MHSKERKDKDIEKRNNLIMILVFAFVIIVLILTMLFGAYISTQDINTITESVKDGTSNIFEEIAFKLKNFYEFIINNNK